MLVGYLAIGLGAKPIGEHEKTRPLVFGCIRVGGHSFACSRLVKYPHCTQNGTAKGFERHLFTNSG